MASSADRGREVTSAAVGRSRPGQRQVVQDELGRDVASDQDRRATEAVEERIQLAGVHSLPDRDRFVEQADVADGSLEARAGTTPGRAPSSVQSAIRASAARRRSAAGV